jgi:Fe2+ or Zn2+ uptake regulation protein
VNATPQDDAAALARQRTTPTRTGSRAVRAVRENSRPTRERPQPARRRSRQRDRVLDWLRATDVHPTAAQIHAGLKSELPSLSLGTVYRNLEILVADGEIDEVPCGVGPARYDGNLEPHHHFNCEACGLILDVDLPLPRGVTHRLASDHGLVSKRAQISFFGLCPDCEDPARESAQRRRPERAAGKVDDSIPGNRRND